jgi:hypothetical protein
VHLESAACLSDLSDSTKCLSKAMVVLLWSFASLLLIAIAIPARVRMPPLGTKKSRTVIRIPRRTVNISVTGKCNGPSNCWVRTFPNLLVKASKVESDTDAGLGIFPDSTGTGATRRDHPNPVPVIRRGDFITEYGGKSIGVSDAIALREEV